MAKKKKKGTSWTLRAGMGLGFFEELVFKKIEAEERLARTFAAFVKLPVGGYFICGGKVPPAYFSSDNFRCIIIGHSLVEISQGESLLREVGSRVSSLFTKNDFYATVATDFLSKYLRANIQNMKIPQALAVEFITIDIRGILVRINLTGDFEIDNLNEDGERIFIVGCYDERFRKSLASELKNAPKEINLDKMRILADRLVSRFKLPHCGFLL